MNLDKLHKELSKIIKGKILVCRPLAEYTSFRIGGPADFLIIPEDIADLKDLVAYIKKNSLLKFILGAGSNLLVKDEGFHGIVIKLDSEAFKHMSYEDMSIRIGAGVSVGRLLSFCADNNLGGLEFLSGIPGTVGGIIKMNAGVREKSISDIAEEVTLIDWDGNTRVLKRSQLEFGYRSFIPLDPSFKGLVPSSSGIRKDYPAGLGRSIPVGLEKVHPVTNQFVTGQADFNRGDGGIKSPLQQATRFAKKEFSNGVKEQSSLTGFTPSDVIILEACFKVSRRNRKDIRSEMEKYLSSKNRTQDLKFPSAGCVFKNPSDANLTSGELIERSGLKGRCSGDAKISEVHGNFIVNTGNAKANDVIFLMNLIEKKVELDYNIKLKPEIVILG